MPSPLRRCDDAPLNSRHPKNAPPPSVVINTAELPNATAHVCPDGRGRMLLRESRYGPFLGCSEYPKCRTSLKINPDGSLKEGQEFTCTFSESAGRSGARKGKTGRSAGTARPRAGGATAGATKTPRRGRTAVSEE